MGVLIALSSCNKEENNWDKYEDWRNANNDFIEAKAEELNAAAIVTCEFATDTCFLQFVHSLLGGLGTGV